MSLYGCDTCLSAMTKSELRPRAQRCKDAAACKVRKAENYAAWVEAIRQNGFIRPTPWGTYEVSWNGTSYGFFATMAQAREAVLRYIPKGARI